MDNDGHAGLFSHKTHRAVLLVHVLAFQTGNVTLARAQVPAQLVKSFPFGIHLGSDDLLVFLKGDGALVSVADP